MSIYYGTQSHIQVKICCHLNFHRASVFNYERLDILRDSFGHLSKKLLSFEISQSFCFQFRASRYIIGLNRTSELNVIVVWIWPKLMFSILSVSIYYETRSSIGVKSYCRLNLRRASIFNYDFLDILQNSIGHPSKKLLSLELAQSFRCQLWASWYITGFIRTSN